MNSKSLTPLGETEMEVLHHVWELSRASVNDIRSRIQVNRPIAYTTVMTVMKNLADKGYLQFEKRGNSYVYFADRPATDVRRSLLNDLVTKVFRGSPLELVETLVGDQSLSDVEMDRIRSLIDGMEDSDV